MNIQLQIKRIVQYNMNDYISQKERQYQNEIVKLFRERLDYEYLGSFQYPQNSVTRVDGEKNSPIIESEMRRFLSSEEFGYTELQIEEAIRQIKDMARLSDSKRGVLAETNNRQQIKQGMMQQLLTGKIRLI